MRKMFLLFAQATATVGAMAQPPSGPPVPAEAGVFMTPPPRTPEQRRNELRSIIQSQQRGKAQVEAQGNGQGQAVGRRLTAQERAELREQLRREYSVRQAANPPAP